MPKLTEWLMAPRPGPEDAPKGKPLRHARYKLNGMAVYFDGSDLPAPCAGCRGISELLCDFPLEDGGSCSAPICSDCAKEIAPDTHLCPLHVRVVQNRKGSLL